MASQVLLACLIFLVSGPARSYEYIVKRGDTLASISQMAVGNSKYWPELQLYNDHITNANKLSPGDKIEIPAKAVIFAMYQASKIDRKLELRDIARANGGNFPASMGSTSPDSEPDPDVGPDKPADKDEKNPRKVNYDSMKCLEPTLD